MSTIPNYPQDLLDEHHHWHDPSRHPGLPGRQNEFGTPGAGLEFLQFHRDFLRRFHAWYDSQPFADLVAVEPWTAIPNALKVSRANWTNTRAAQERRIVTNNPSFTSADALGTYIEGGIHGWLHSASAIIFNEPVMAEFHSPLSTYFYQLHGLVDRWWRLWEIPTTDTPVRLTVGGGPMQASIGSAGESDVFEFVVTAAGTFTMETQGSTDVVMSLYGPNNLATFIAEDDDGGPASNARITRNLTAGSYYLRIRHYSQTGTGNYSVSVLGVAVNMPEVVVNGGEIPGSIAAPGENDFYTFSAAAAGLYTIETAGETDTVVTLFGPENQTAFIAEDDDGGPAGNSRIMTSLQPGRYYLRVRHYSAARTGEYTLRVAGP